MPSLTQLTLFTIIPSIQLVSSLSIPHPLRARQTLPAAGAVKRDDGDYAYAAEATSTASATAAAYAESSGYPVLPGQNLTFSLNSTDSFLNSTDSYLNGSLPLNITALLEGYDLALLTYENGTAYIINESAEVECTGVGECEEFLKTVGVEEIECDDDSDSGSDYDDEEEEEEGDCDDSTSTTTDEVDVLTSTLSPTPTSAASPVGNNYAVTGGNVGTDGYTSVTSTAWMYVTSGAAQGATGTSFGSGAVVTASPEVGGDTTVYGATKTVTEYVTITIDGSSPRVTNSPLSPGAGASATSLKAHNNLASPTSSGGVVPAATGTGVPTTGSGSGTGTVSETGDDDDEEDCEDGDYEDDGDETDGDDEDDIPDCDDEDDEESGETGTGTSYDDEDGEDCDDEDEDEGEEEGSLAGNIVAATATATESYSYSEASATLSYDDAYVTDSASTSATYSAEYVEAATATASASDASSGDDEDVYTSYVDVYATEYVDPATATASASDEAVTIVAADSVVRRHGHGRGRSLRKVVRRV